MSNIRLAIVGRRETIREGLTKLLAVTPDFEVVSSTRTVEEAVGQCRIGQPNVILVCCSLNEYGGIKSIEHIHEKLPKSHIVFISDSGANDELIAGVGAGVRAYLSPDISVSNLICAITLVTEGKLIVSPGLAEGIITNIESLFRHERKLLSGEITMLTKREQAVLRLIKQGLTNREIAAALNVSEHTVKVHVQNIMGKTHAHTRQEAVNTFSQKDVLHRIGIN